MVQIVKAGSLNELAGLLLEEFFSKGYALSELEVLEVLKTECRYMMSWTPLNLSPELAVIHVNENTELSNGEWGVLEPVIRAHCDLLQAQRVDASKSLGEVGFGLTVSEAEQTYLQERDAIPKKCFIEAPYSIELE